MKTICAILFFVGASLLASAQTPPITPCANGQPYVLKPDGTYQCPPMPLCLRMCTTNAGAPAKKQCYWGPTNPPTEGGAAVVDYLGNRLDNQAVNGYRCAWQIHRWMGEYPFGDPRNGPIPYGQ
jgi:hypothetical protein